MDQMQTQEPTPSSGSNKKTIIIVVIAVVAIGALGMFARGFFGGSMAERAAERAIERAGGGNADVDLQGDTATFTSDEGSMTVGENVSLPDNWPSDVSIMQGGKIYYAMSSNPSTGESGMGAVFGTAQSANNVIGYYKTELPKQGWTIEGEFNVAGASVLSATKGDRSLSLSIVGGDDETSVTIGVSE